jgi:hypothetical protein
VEQTSRPRQGENGENRDLEFFGFHNAYLEGESFWICSEQPPAVRSIFFREQLSWNKLGKGNLN